ncbi:MAG: VWA domain-containing protein [Phycisphaeraceae bacterium]|nr:VWA domain-containing protein [Phycisphaeraceae bacterium]
MSQSNQPRRLWKATVPLSVLLGVLITALILAPTTEPAFAREGDQVTMAPEGGRLDARDPQGNIIGPCPLEHTDVQVHISGHFTRVNVTQTYTNPYDHKIEAVYTFPLSHRSAVDRMTMTVGDRVIEGEVRRREVARLMYESARRQGYVASLLEQERPNIFTQSVANIEPGEKIEIRISYVEVLESVDGEYQFQFPTVVAPRYIPGAPGSPDDGLPEGIQPTRGLVLLAPAKIESPDRSALALSDQWLRQHTVPVSAEAINKVRGEKDAPDSRARFVARYDDGVAERGEIFNDGFGHVGGRWFFCPPRMLPPPGHPFAINTDQVPDADRITPMPVKPDQRAGHDISITVHIDTGGPGISSIGSNSHELVGGLADGLPQRVTVRLKNEKEIPNRDFVLKWRLSSDDITEALLMHTGDYGKFEGGFFTLILEPPARVREADIRPRELIFVLDNSGSMLGARLADRSALDAAKDVINQTIDTMRPDDRFNIVSFNHTLDVLWDAPKPNTEDNRKRAQAYVDQRQGGGGTEMRNAVLRALGAGPFEAHRPKPDQDGAAPMRIVLFVTDGLVGNDAAIIQAVRNHAHETRVFSIGMSNAPNRHLLDEMARVGRGAVDYVLPADDVTPIVERFTQRIATPVLTDIQLNIDGVQVTDILPSPEHMPDLFDFQPLVIHGRYTQPGTGELTIKGRTGAGAYERRIALSLPREEPRHDVIATLWARSKVGELSRESNTQEEIVVLGESFQIMTQHTSFVAVDRARVTVGGEPVMVRVPIEFPKGMSWEGIFGVQLSDDDLARRFAPSAEPDGSRFSGRPDLGRIAPMRGAATKLAPDEVATRPMAEPAVQPRLMVENEHRPDGQLAPMAPSPRDVSMIGGLRIDGRQSAVGGHFFPGDIPTAQELPGGTRLGWAILRNIEDTRRAGQLRVALGGRADGTIEEAQPLGRVILLESEKMVRILAVAPMIELIEPFARRLEAEQADVDAIFGELIVALERDVPRIARDMELQRVLDERLHERAMKLRDDADKPLADELLRITVLLHDLEEATLRSLTAAGLEIQGRTDNPTFVVGQIQASKLESLALLDQVRRVELMP